MFCGVSWSLRCEIIAARKGVRVKIENTLDLWIACYKKTKSPSLDAKNPDASSGKASADSAIALLSLAKTSTRNRILRAANQRDQSENEAISARRSWEMFKAKAYQKHVEGMFFNVHVYSFLHVLSSIPSRPTKLPPWGRSSDCSPRKGPWRNLPQCRWKSATENLVPGIFRKNECQSVKGPHSFEPVWHPNAHQRRRLFISSVLGFKN